MCFCQSERRNYLMLICGVCSPCLLGSETRVIGFLRERLSSSIVRGVIAFHFISFHSFENRAKDENSPRALSARNFIVITFRGSLVHALFAVRIIVKRSALEALLFLFLFVTRIKNDMDVFVGVLFRSISACSN